MAWLAASGILLLTGAASPPPERIVDGDGIVAVTVNGTPGHLRIDPGAPGMPLIDAAFAGRAGVKGGMFGFIFKIGPERIAGRTAVAKIDLGQGPFKRRVGWSTRSYASIADGAIGPADLPEPVIRFLLNPARVGERTVTMPMVDGGGLFGGFAGLYGQIMVGGEPLRIRFDPWHPRSLANAGAAARIAAAQGGKLSGETTRREIAYGIARPVRDMTLARPLQIGPLSILALGVRTGDGSGAATIADADAPPPDPDEVIVTAKGKAHDPNRDRVAIGADLLMRCSSLVFDKPARQIRLTCG